MPAWGRLFINQFIATGVLEFVWQLFRNGGLDYSEVYVNLENFRMMSVAITSPVTTSNKESSNE